MRHIAIASDHAGFGMKNFLIEELKDSILFDDLGCHSPESCDYPIFAQDLSKQILLKKYNFGVLLCGSGIGVSIVANRFEGIRAALCHSKDFARLAREHNNANVLCLPARFVSDANAIEIVTEFLGTRFSNDPKHQKRIDIIDEK